MDISSFLSIFRSIIALSIIILFTGCGGGGGGGNDVVPTALSLTLNSPTGDVSINEGETVNFQCTVSGGTTPYTFEWNFDGGATNSIEEDPGSITFSTPGTYGVILTVTDDAGSSKNTSITVTVRDNSQNNSNQQPLSATITSPTSNVTITQNESVNFQATVSGGTAPYTYLWDFDGGASNRFVEDPGAIIFNSVGIYQVQLTVTDHKGVTANASIIITVPTYIGSGILSGDTVWSQTAAPYILTGTVQVPYGNILTINPGVNIIGNLYPDAGIRVYGTLNAVGNISNKIRFTDVCLSTDDSMNSQNIFNINLQYCEISDGLINGSAGYGSMSIKDSILQGIGAVILWYPVADCFFERNIFSDGSGINLGISGNIIVHIKNNVFSGYSCSPPNPSSYAIENWACYDTAEVLVEYNSFLTTDCIALSLANNNGDPKMTAINNYWNTTDSAVIASMIHDKSTDLSCSGYITYIPFLTSPDPNTPIITSP